MVPKWSEGTPLLCFLVIHPFICIYCPSFNGALIFPEFGGIEKVKGMGGHSAVHTLTVREGGRWEEDCKTQETKAK
jgi:hypothetical protein